MTSFVVLAYTVVREGLKVGNCEIMTSLLATQTLTAVPTDTYYQPLIFDTTVC